MYLNVCKSSNTDSIILGDLNIHLNEEQNYDTETLTETLASLGYKQHVSFYTHVAGHILDAVITKIDSDLIVKCVLGKFLSDHRAVICALRCHKEVPHSRVKSVRKWNIELDQFFNNLSKIQLPSNESTNLDTLVELFEEDVRRCVDKHAPLTDKKIIPRRKFPWYNADIKAQKQRLRRTERVWKDTKLQTPLRL